MARCEEKACVNPALPGSTFCVRHKPAIPIAPAKPTATTVEDDVQFIRIEEIPSARLNTDAMNLLAALKNGEATRAIKVRLKKYSKPTCFTARKYALTQGLRVGVRIVGEWAYLWKMTPQQVKDAEERARAIAQRRKERKVA